MDSMSACGPSFILEDPGKDPTVHRAPGWSWRKWLNAEVGGQRNSTTCRGAAWEIEHYESNVGQFSYSVP